MSGCGTGCPAAAASAGASRVLASVLFGVTPTDAATYSGTAMTLLAVTAVASLVPAWRAATVDPASALHDE